MSRTRAALLLTASLSAALWAGAVAALGLGVMARLPPSNAPGRFAVATALVIVMAVLWRWRWSLSTRRVALWLEERTPELQYALVTAVEPRFAGLAGELNARVAAAPTARAVRRVMFRWLVPAAAAALASVAVAALVPRSAVGERLAELTPGGGAGSLGLPAPLSGIIVEIRPPVYSGGRLREQREPETIRALVGSRITVRGSGDGVSVALGDQRLGVAGGDWRASFVMPLEPRALRLRHDASGIERVLVVDPIPDDPPRATLTAPARDTLLRASPASVAVSAEIADDIGLAAAAIEYMVSSGQEETYTARTGRIAARSLGGERSARLSGVLTAAQLRLGPGDLLSIRAVASDRNDVSGPGIGASETRTIRIARSDDFDSLSVEAMAPVFGDSALLSQREILRRTELLVRVMQTLPRDTLLSRIARLGFDQERLRDRVHSVVFPGHEHADESELAGEPPDHAEPADPVDADLKVAYEAMWDAARELRIAAPSAAIPPMRVAADALDRARMANRLYLRGGSPRVIVNVEEVRLTGSERGRSSRRAVRAPADTLLRVLRGRLASLASQGDVPRAQRLNSLNELRVELLRVSPRAAAALERAGTALRRGDDPAAELRSAAAELVGEAVVRETPPAWSAW